MFIRKYIEFFSGFFILRAWDGSGNFTRTNGTQNGAVTWADADAAGNDITTTQHDTHDEDLADGIAACLTKDNQSKPTAAFKPNADATYDLGSALLQWKDIFLSGTAKISAFAGGGTKKIQTDNNGALGVSDWIRKTTTYTAASGERIKTSTTGGAWSLTFPASPADDDEIEVQDVDGTFSTNNLTLLVNGKKIMGYTTSFVLDTRYAHLVFVYDTTLGDWRF